MKGSLQVHVLCAGPHLESLPWVGEGLPGHLSPGRVIGFHIQHKQDLKLMLEGEERRAK